MKSKTMWGPMVAALLLPCLYLLLARGGGGLGFPLDDGWIHQTYARNLAETGRWAYMPGITSTGSTAPLWTILLAIGYLLHIPYLFWSYALGILFLILLVAGIGALWAQLWPELAAYRWVPALITAAAWPLLWAAVSGMETIAFAALTIWIMVWYDNIRFRYTLRLGLLGGLLILTRPDGVVLLALLTLLFLWERDWRAFGLLVAGTAAIIIPYFALNYWVAGAIWPNTMYAKQTEYAVYLTRFFPIRLLDLLYFSMGSGAGGQGMSSAHLLLLPGLLTAGWQALKLDWDKRTIRFMLPLLWAGGHIFLYAWRLPVLYQHGRYLIPAIAVWILYGVNGWQYLLAHPIWQKLPLANLFDGRFWPLVNKLVFAVVLTLFIFLGGNAYAQDVAVIEGEMVTVARWVAANTAPDALIAAHDIGAIGYFAERPLLDLAGLITPEIIPLLVDEQLICDYLLQEGDADYLITAPGWSYDCLTKTEQVVIRFTTDFALTREHGLNNMTVFQFER